MKYNGYSEGSDRILHSTVLVIGTAVSSHHRQRFVVALIHPLVMKIIYNSVNLASVRRGFSRISEKLQSYPQLKYLLVVPFIVAIAFNSYKVRTIEQVRRL